MYKNIFKHFKRLQKKISYISYVYIVRRFNRFFLVQILIIGIITNLSINQVLTLTIIKKS